MPVASDVLTYPKMFTLALFIGACITAAVTYTNAAPALVKSHDESETAHVAKMAAHNEHKLAHEEMRRLMKEEREEHTEGETKKILDTFAALPKKSL
ncbi:MAG: hypothetical protein V3V85_06745 [Candidatus Thorarchaeota archaeon]